MKSNSSPYHRLVSLWLFIGVVMIFFQIMLGGITRLTGSGLSITRWDIVTGTVPPLNARQWDQAFDLYKQTPQYQHINKGMSLGEFKFIYFWEYVHRLWARTMGFVFFIPFLFFLYKKALPRKLIRRLGVVVLLASLAALFGWIMVASGLIERPWVDAYKLTIHLGLGISLFIYMFFTWLSFRGYKKMEVFQNRSLLVWLIGVAILQIAFGGILSGMKAALMYPTWPTMHGEWIPSIILDLSHWNADNFLLYDKSGFMAALIQFLHRNLGYGLAILIFIFLMKKQSAGWQWIRPVLLGIIVAQVLLGILTLLNSTGSIPVLYGSLHQAVGILLLTFLIYLSRVMDPSIVKQ